MNQKQIRAAVEAMLFAYAEPIGADKLAQAVQLPQLSVEAALEALRERYAREDSGLCLLHLNTRWQLATKTQWADCIRRLLDSRRTGLGADIELPDAALHAEVLRFAGEQGESAARFAFRGGEDYALIGTCPPELEHALETLGARRLGEVRAGGMTLNGTPWTASGFDHFG